jgi:hypothetical protein
VLHKVISIFNIFMFTSGSEERFNYIMHIHFSIISVVQIQMNQLLHLDKEKYYFLAQLK